jgi:hypothetical protein
MPSKSGRAALNRKRRRLLEAGGGGVSAYRHEPRRHAIGDARVARLLARLLAHFHRATTAATDELRPAVGR